MNDLYIKLLLGIYLVILLGALVIFFGSGRDTELHRTAGRALLVCVLLAAFPLMILADLVKRTK